MTRLKDASEMDPCRLGRLQVTKSELLQVTASQTASDNQSIQVITRY